MAAADLRRRLLELDAQIVKQKLVLAELERDRAAAQHELHATATYPVVSLPFEITAKFFVHCLPLPHENFYSESPMAQELRETVPLVLLSVCRAWRNDAIATPSLWSTVSSKPGLIEGFIDLWLSRAGRCPLSLSFKLYGFEGMISEDSPFQSSRVRDIIHRHSHRLQRLELGMAEWEIRKLELQSASFPLLQSARLGCAYSPGNDPHPGAVFGNAPRLHDFSLLRSAGGTTLGSFSLPWLQLTKFEGQVDNLDLFTLAPNLCEAKIYSDSESFEPPPSTITHAKLHSLTLVQEDSGSFNIFPFLTLPALQSLDISAVHPPTYLPLRSFIMRSSPPLLSLSVNAGQMYFSDWAQSFPHVAATLENLTLRYPSTPLLSTIFDSGGCLTSLRTLRNLSLLDVYGPLDFQELSEFILIRGDLSRKLVSFRLVWSSSRSFDREIYAGGRNTIATGFAQMTAAAGMSIYIGTKDTNYAAFDGNPA
ncbi:hypothetical protein FB451DRAFT_1328394 [Mycena latifolia]|nr:hypothetical protein FB451DRAFT_1328394 [Mycena latifolia]